MPENFSQKRTSFYLKQPMLWAFLWLSILVTFLVYLPVLDNAFVNWDDPFYVQKNPHIHQLSLSNLKWMATSVYTGNWIPLTWLSFAWDYHLGGSNPLIFHLDNLILHCLNTALVFLLSRRILSISVTRDGKTEAGHTPFVLSVTAFLAALLFGVHPIHVESVAWASERKDLLCGFFYLSSLLFYLNYLSQSNHKKWKLYACLGTFCLALMSKSMAVTLPVVLLLLDYWPARRLWSQPFKVLLEKVPFFCASLITGSVTVFYQDRIGAVANLNELSLAYRLMNAFHATNFYLEKMVWPLGLTTFYPINLKNTFSAGYLFSFICFILICSFVYLNRKNYPFLVTAWLYYLVTLAPVIGILQVGSQSAADRYTYLPSLGPLLLFVGVLNNLFSKWRAVFLIFLVVLIGFLGIRTNRQIEVWRDSVSLWENVLRIYPNNSAYAFNNLASAYEDAGRFDEALRFYDIAILKASHSTYPPAGKGEVLLNLGFVDKAIEQFKNSIAFDPNYDLPHNGLGKAYEKKGLYPEVLVEFQEALRLNPDNAEAYNNLGILYRDLLKFRESLNAFRKAMALDPTNSKYSRNLMETCRMERFP